MQYVYHDVLEMRAEGHVYQFCAHITRDMVSQIQASLYGREPRRVETLLVNAHLEIFRNGEQLGEGTSLEPNPFSLQPVKTDLKDRPFYEYEQFGEAIRSVNPKFVFPFKWAKNEAETYALWIKRCTELGTTEAAKAYLAGERIKEQQKHIESLKSIIFSCELVRDGIGRIPSHSEAVRIRSKRYGWPRCNHGSYGLEDYEKAVTELERLGESYPGKDKTPAKSVNLQILGGLEKLIVTETGWHLSISEYGDPHPTGTFWLFADSPIFITNGVRNMLAYLLCSSQEFEITKDVKYMYMKGASDEEIQYWAEQGRRAANI